MRSSETDLEKFVQKLANISDEAVRRKLLKTSREFHDPSTVEYLYEETVHRALADLQAAERLERSAAWIAAQLRDDLSRAFSQRATGHICFLRGRQVSALKHYERAIALFRRYGRELDVGRALASGLQTLIYQGQYGKAFAWAQEARKIFARHGDHLRLARLDSNLGNILYRQDRFDEALEHYQRAEKELRYRGEPKDVGVTLTNIAVCHISLNHFTQALHAYQEARAFCQTHNLPLLVAQADYNIAYLHYLRGEYTRAIELYQAARTQHALLGDSYHTALCDLDQAEMYLELNLVDEGAQLADQAFRSFEALQMGYEAAKALAFQAIALSQKGETSLALAAFRRARQRFVREQNRVWPALIDLYQALVLFQDEKYVAARRLCKAAFQFFSRSSLTSKTALCELLLARLYLHAADNRLAKTRCLAALKKLERIESPTLWYQASFVLGQIEEALGNPTAAQQAYQRAHAGLEGLRTHLRGEELKISFLKDKLAVYESLVWLALSGPAIRKDPQAAFAYVEYAKSRSLADLIAFRASTLPAGSASGNPTVERVRQLREKLTWYYRQIDLQETAQHPEAAQHLRQLRHRTSETERLLLRTLSDLRATEREFSSLQSAGTIPLDSIRTVLPADAFLVEYYSARGTLYVCLVSRESLDFIPLGESSRARVILRHLQFQLSKFRLGPDYVRSTANLLLQATQSHLRELYEILIAPIRSLLTARHLVIVPHGFLHYLPFHALHDGREYLIDSYSVSYAPSASVYYLCCTKRHAQASDSLIIGVPDPQVPHIVEEVRAVAAALPRPRLFIGEEASEECIRRHGPNSRFVHIATHGLFRQDNPMFSSLRLGNSQLTLFDLYNLQLPAELVTLSGCGTGLNVVVGGDELLGLVRGLLYAGAQALLVTLWDVNDRSTADFMKIFYHHLQKEPDKASAARKAMQDLRDSYPHPYFWAPFCMVGRLTSDGAAPPLIS